MTDGQEILDDVLGRLDGVRTQHGYWMARCPAHEDRTASLQVARGTDQPVVMKCMAGCDTGDVLAAIGLTLAGISGAAAKPAGEWTPHGEATAVYDYTDEDGTLLYQVLRCPGKQFPVRVPDPASRTGWRWRLGGTRRVLYRLPKLKPAIDDGQVIFIVEGERDVQSLERAGVVATCNPGGAGKWRPEYSEVFRDAMVQIVADADKPGRAHARAVAESLEGIAAAVDILEAAEGKDVTDHLASGRTLADLVTTRDGNAESAPELALDLNTFVAQPDPLQRWVIKDLMERCDRLLFTGTPGLGKSMVTRQLAVAAAAGIHPFDGYAMPPQKVLYLDCENTTRKSRRRFRDLTEVCGRLGRPVPDGGFMIVHRPAGIDLTKGDDTEFVMERVTAYRPDLLVIGPLYKLHATDANEETSARAITSVLDLTLGICGSALIVEAHAPHGDLLRPAGSGLFTRWPDFGYGIKRKDPASRKRVLVRAWRGPRDDNPWPSELVWGTTPTDFPWVAPTAEANGHKTAARQGNWQTDLMEAP